MSMFSRRSAGYLVVATSLLLSLVPPSLAQQEQVDTIGTPEQVLQSLRAGGYVIVVRHGATSLRLRLPAERRVAMVRRVLLVRRTTSFERDA
jgi:hypothetical protein